MGQTIPRPRLAVGVVAGAAALAATAILLSSLSSKAEEVDECKAERPTAEAKAADKDANEKLRLAAEKNAVAMPRPPDFDALEVKGLLGCGGFGAVELVQDKVSGKTFALKSLCKGYIVKTGMQTSVRSERIILMLMDSKFIVKCYGTYNRPEDICFLLEPCLGGELYATYNRKKFHGSEQHARYYFGSVILAVDHMHSKSVVRRDAKPEDCVLDREGRLKLIDMGLAKVIVGKTYTTCGTPDYFAPEVIASVGHSFPVDWWASGILLFELLAGHTPFEAAYPMKIYSNVLKGIDKVGFPPGAKNAEPLIKGLLERAPEQRLPALPGGIMNVKKHKWYAGFDWEGLENHNLAPPYVPLVKSENELSEFSARHADRPRKIPYEDDGSGWADDF